MGRFQTRLMSGMGRSLTDGRFGWNADIVASRAAGAFRIASVRSQAATPAGNNCHHLSRVGALPTAAKPQIERRRNAHAEAVRLGEGHHAAQAAIKLLESFEAVPGDVGQLTKNGETRPRLVFP